MFIVRPIQKNDFDGLKKIAIESGHGFTSLPVDDSRLKEKINHSLASTEQQWQQRGEDSYLFVLEELNSGNIVGTTAIEASVGLSVPLYHYRQSKIMQHSTKLGFNKQLDVLTVCNDYTGATEICTLYLDQAFRKNKLGRFLSKVRFMFMADNPERFSQRVIAEMRGAADECGTPPFWRWLKEHFLKIDFATADHLVGTGNKSFITQLMPSYPIYLSTLPAEAQEVIGHVHKNTKPALELLTREGFEHKGYVDLFDAGPTVEARLKDITSVTNSFLATVEIDDKIASEQDFMPEQATFALSNLEVKEFRACISQTIKVSEQEQSDPQVKVSAKLAYALRVSSGEKLRVLEL